jgi:hypothetical protein
LRLAVEMTSVDDRLASPDAAESTTRDGVTVITFVGGASNSVPTAQLVTKARPAREARRSRVGGIE